MASRTVKSSSTVEPESEVHPAGLIPSAVWRNALNAFSALQLLYCRRSIGENGSTRPSPAAAVAKEAQMKTEGRGRSVRRFEDFRFLTGAGRYVEDLALPGQVHAHVLRSPHAHAAIERIDTAAAC